MSYTRVILASLLSLAAPLASSAASLVSTPHPLITEHVDLNISLSGTDWTLEPRDNDAGGVPYPSGLAILHVDAASQTSRPASSAFDFIGTPSGTPYYRLPQSQNQSLLFLGIAGYGVTPSQIDSYNASTESGGRVSGTGRWVKLLLDSVRGPGQFSLWQDSLGGPNVFISTATTAPGNAGIDAAWILANGHTHFNYGFTKPGLYEVNFRPSAFENNNNASTLGPVLQAAEPLPVYFNVNPGYATSAAVASSTLPSVGNLPFFGGFREITLAPNTTRGALRIGEVGLGNPLILLKLADPSELGALTVALSGFDGTLYDLPSVPPTATIDNSLLPLYPDYHLALRFSGIAPTFDFEFDYSMILAGVRIDRIGVYATTALVPEPSSVLSLLVPAALLRRHRRPS